MHRDKLITTKAGITHDDFHAAYQNGRIRTERLLISKGFSADEAQEISQAAWVRGWERRKQLRENGRILAWVNTIALNIGRDLRRRVAPISLEDAPMVPEHRGDLVSAVDARKLLAECSEADRLLLEQHYLEGRKVIEIARRQGHPASTVRVRLHRLRNSLRAHFEAPAHRLAGWGADLAPATS